jgi:hypothetical protein
MPSEFPARHRIFFATRKLLLFNCLWDFTRRRPGHFRNFLGEFAKKGETQIVVSAS